MWRPNPKAALIGQARREMARDRTALGGQSNSGLWSTAFPDTPRICRTCRRSRRNHIFAATTSPALRWMTASAPAQYLPEFALAGSFQLGLEPLLISILHKGSALHERRSPPLWRRAAT